MNKDEGQTGNIMCRRIVANFDDIPLPREPVDIYNLTDDEAREHAWMECQTINLSNEKKRAEKAAFIKERMGK